MPKPDTTEPAPYPDEWASDVVLADGGTLRLRPVRPDDDERLGDLYEQLSDESIYLRFFSPVPRPAARQLERLANVDYRDHMVLVALLGDEMLAIARYDRLDDAASAEVAFTVRDDQSGRGLATLLLEHLAAIANAHGIRRFVASTLPQNRKMLNVFRDAGYEVQRRFADGTIELEFPIAPTESSIAASEERERVSEGRSVARLLAPGSIAVVGAGRDPRSLGHHVLRNLVDGGFTGAIHVVHREADEVAGLPAHRSLRDVPGPVDLVIVTVPAASVPAVVDDAAAVGAHGLVVLSAGFAELGEAGRIAEAELVTTARRNGMRLVGPNCMGVVNTNPAIQMNATFAPLRPVRGRVGFLSQSGALGIELLDRAGRLGIGISSFVAVGNKADVSGNDLLQHWEDDPDTDVVLLYLESFGNPRKFARIARRVGRHKPIVAVKSGRSGVSARVAPSLVPPATADFVIDALFRHAGVIRVDTLEDLFDVATVLVHQPAPRGRRVAIVGNAAGPGILAADACIGAGLEVPELSLTTQAELRALLPQGDPRVRNPVDLSSGAEPATFEAAIRCVVDDPGIDAVLVHFVPPLLDERAEEIAAGIARGVESAGETTVLACYLAQEGVPEPFRGDGGRRSVPSFAFPDKAVRALARATERAEWIRRPTGRVPGLEELGIDLPALRARVEAALVDDPLGSWLPLDDAAALLATAGLDTAPTRLVDGADEAVAVATDLGFPVALKAVTGALVHRSETDALHLALRDGDEVRQAWRRIADALGDRLDAAAVQPMVPESVRVIAAIAQDALFGPVIRFSLGGPGAELIGDATARTVPVTDRDAHELVRELRASPLFFGYRGAPPVAVDRLEDALVRLGVLADEMPELAEVVLDPVLLSPERAVAVDVHVRVCRPAPALPEGLRRMRTP